ncbi:hypothetical protein ACLOJK_029769 [Asimina triloba]
MNKGKGKQVMVEELVPRLRSRTQRLLISKLGDTDGTRLELRSDEHHSLDEDITVSFMEQPKGAYTNGNHARTSGVKMELIKDKGLKEHEEL